MMRAPSSAWRCMSAHSSVVRLRGLQEDRVGDGELADVVEERGMAEQVELGLRQARARAPIASASCCTRREWPAV